MSAKGNEYEIEDDLARGEPAGKKLTKKDANIKSSSENPARIESQDIKSVEKEFRPRKRCPLPGFKDRLAYPESHGIGGGMLTAHEF